MPRKKQNRKPNYKRIKATELYYVDELATTLDVHANTIGNMMKDGMRIIEGSYPYIIRGQFAIDYLKERRKKVETKLQQDEFLCFGCGRKPSKAKHDFVTLQITAPKTGSLKAICCVCGTALNRKISLEDLPKFQKIMNIQQLPNLPLSEGVNNSGICETNEVRKND